MEQNITYAFGPYRLETNTHLLRYESETITLPPKIHQLLLFFLQNPGHLISREVLLDAVWSGTFVEDTALRRAVNTLRKALNDDSKTPCYILTVSKRGYRFLPDITVEVGFLRSAGTTQAVDINYQPKTEYPGSEGQYDIELAQLLKAFQRAADGNRRLVLLKGARGTGKTALLERFLAKINPPELAFLRARCIPLNGTIEPYLPLLEALERKCREPCGKPLIRFLQQIAPAWFYQIVNVLDPQEFGTFRLNAPQIGSARMLREGANLFEKLGAESTFILILDNSHWSDKFTLDLLNFLISRSSPTKLLMILSFRPGENGAGARRLEQMRSELCYRGVSQELSLHRRLEY